MSKTIKIFDTTLRDGEQSPGCSMNKNEKIEVAKQLEKLGVDIIEAGFAISSQGDFESIQAISKTLKTPIICSLSRAIKKDIKLAAESIQEAKHKRIHTFIATSPIHMEYKLNMTPEQVIENAINAIKYAKSFVNDVEFSCEDAGRSDPEFLVKVLNEAIKAGATVVNIPDTVGYMMPTEYGNLIKYLSNNVIGIENVDISVHCHNDLGVATANALAGVINGATQIECTLNGIGERAGNTALEEVVMALTVREDNLKARTNIITKEISKSSKLISTITGSVIQPNKAIVGANAFSHEAGIHQDGMLKQKRTYEIMDAQMVGISQNNLVLGKHSGRHAFKNKLETLGLILSNDEINKAFDRFKQLADKKKDIEDDDIESIVSDETRKTHETFILHTVEVNTHPTKPPVATITIEKDNTIQKAQQPGAGPVDAIYKTIDTLTQEKTHLIDYTIQSVTKGTDAIAEVLVKLSINDRIFTGRGASLDVLIASAKAYVSAINKQVYFQKQGQQKAHL